MARDGESGREKRHGRGTKEEETENNSSKKKSKRHVEEDEDSESSMETEEYSSSSSSGEDDGRKNSMKKSRKRKSSRRRHSDSESNSESESERRRKRRERKRREEKRRRREKDKKKRKVDEVDDDERRRKRRKKEKREKDEKKKRREKEKRGKIGAVTNSWGKYGIIREVDMWNKRPEFSAWLAEVKQVNLESLPNRDEKIMFKDYMEDYNTATFPSKKYYDLDAYHRRKMEKEMKKGFRKVTDTEHTVFNDEEQRRQELLQAREKQKEQEIVALKDAMKSGMAQAMKEQVRLKEEMVYLYKIGNIEAAAAIQKRLDPDVAM